MRLPAILCSDLHLTEKPADEYRWGLFPWLEGELRGERAETLLVLGDLTDAKDYHPAQLVNRVVRAFESLRRHVPRIVVLAGNHDRLKDGHTFFEFLAALPGVEVITRPTEDQERSKLTYFLPFTRNPAADWAGMDFSHYEYLFMHQTVKGAVASNGQQMDGERLPPLDAGKVYSGDIHVPQQIGRVEYVGSPYHVHFGDRFKPRCVAIERDGRAFDLHYPTISRVTVDVRGAEGVRSVRLAEGDQVKMRVHLAESEKHGWRAIREEALAVCDRARVDLRGLELVVDRARVRARPGDRPAADFDPQRALYRFVEADALGGDLLDVGLECME